MERPLTKATSGTRWTPAEDELLRKYIARYEGTTRKWAMIAEHIPGRSETGCRVRWAQLNGQRNRPNGTRRRRTGTRKNSGRGKGRNSLDDVAESDYSEEQFDEDTKSESEVVGDDSLFRPAKRVKTENSSDQWQTNIHDDEASTSATTSTASQLGFLDTFQPEIVAHELEVADFSPIQQHTPHPDGLVPQEPLLTHSNVNPLHDTTMMLPTPKLREMPDSHSQHNSHILPVSELWKLIQQKDEEIRRLHRDLSSAHRQIATLRERISLIESDRGWLTAAQSATDPTHVESLL